MFDDVSKPESIAMQRAHDALSERGYEVRNRQDFRFGWIGGRTWAERVGGGYLEIDHNGPAAGVLHDLRQDLGPLLTVVSEILHRYQPIPEGQKWTVPLLMACGFEGAFVITVASAGRCGPQAPMPEDPTKARGEAAAHIERAPEYTAEAQAAPERWLVVTGWGKGYTYDCTCWDGPGEPEEIIAETYTLADAARIVLAFTGPDVEPRPKS